MFGTRILCFFGVFLSKKKKKKKNPKNFVFELNYMKHIQNVSLEYQN
jgi:hypothetical protein